MEWSQIDTAPRDGIMVLFWSRERGHFVGNWPPGCGAGYWTKVGGNWQGYSDWRASEATHWMRLPKAPNT